MVGSIEVSPGPLPGELSPALAICKECYRVCVKRARGGQRVTVDGPVLVSSLLSSLCGACSALSPGASGGKPGVSGGGSPPDSLCGHRQ